MGYVLFLLFLPIINMEMEMEMEMEDLPRSIQHGLDISDPTPTSMFEAYRYLTKVNIQSQSQSQSQSHIQLDLTVPNNNSSTTKNGEGDDDDHGMDVVITSSNRCWEDEIPTEILTKILLAGIPIRRLIQYLCVSKTWFHTIFHHMDPNLLLANQEPGIIVIHTSPGKSTRLSFNVRQEEGVKPKSIDHAPFDILLSGHSRFESSCNGLICLKQYSSSFETSYCDSSISSTSTTANYRILVCNPYLLEATTLPNIIYSSSSSFPTKQQQHHNERNPPFSFKENYGLGFSPSTNQYKVVRITWYDRGYTHMMKHVYRYSKNKEDGSIQELTRRQPQEVRILTLGTNSWRIVSSVLPLPIYDPPVFANGSLHWKVDTRNASDYSRNIVCIISFDIGKEEFHIITQPPYVSRYVLTGELANLDLIDWRGSLAMVKEDYGKSLDIWVLHLNNNNNNKKKQQLWIREYTLQSTLKTDHIAGTAKVIGLWKHGEILAYINSSMLISFDPDTGELLELLKCPPTLISFDPKTNKKRQIHVRSGFESISTYEHEEFLAHTGSLVSLKAYGCKTWRTAPGLICSNLYNRDR